MSAILRMAILLLSAWSLQSSLLGSVAAQTPDSPLEEFVPGHAMGTIQSDFDVDNHGAGVYTAKLPVPPGVAGLTPTLEIKCVSPGGFGGAGRGCNLVAAPPYIHRCRHAEALDGFNGGPRLDKADGPLCYGDQRLVALNGDAGYRTYIDSNVRIIPSTELCAGAPCTFEVRTPDGGVTSYGTTADARLTTNEERPFTWFASRTRDSHGNYILYTYSSSAPHSERLLTRIDYTGGTNHPPRHQILLSYKDAVRRRWRYNGSSRARYSRILSRIEVRTNNDGDTMPLYGYQLDHDSRDQLGRIRQCLAGGGCFPAETLTWSNRLPGLGWADGVDAMVHDINLTLETDDDYRQFYPVGDVNGNGYADLVKYDVEDGRSNNPGRGSMRLLSFDGVEFNNGAHIFQDVENPAAYSLARGHNGFSFHLIRRDPGNPADSLECVERFYKTPDGIQSHFGPCNYQSLKKMYGDYYGRGDPSMYNITHAHLETLGVAEGAEMKSSTPGHPLDIDPDNLYLPGDFNADGKMDLFLVGSARFGTAENGGWIYLAEDGGRFSVKPWEPSNISQNQLNNLLTHEESSNRREVVSGDFDGDGLTDFLVYPRHPHALSPPTPKQTVLYMSRGDGRMVRVVATVSGFGLEEGDHPLLLHYPAHDIHAVDLNGDGITDLVVTRKPDAAASNWPSPALGVSLGRPDGRFRRINSQGLSGGPLALLLADDFDNNGTTDLIVQGEPRADGDYKPARYFRFNTRKWSFLTHVETGRKKEFTIDYVRNVDRRKPLPVVDGVADGYKRLPPYGYVVESFTENYGGPDDSSETWHMAYGTYIGNEKALNPATFDRIERVTNKAGAKHLTRTTFRRYHPLAGLPKRIETIVVKDGVELPHTTSTYVYNFVEHRVRPERRTVNHHLDQIKKITTYEYDDYGQPTLEREEYLDQKTDKEPMIIVNHRRTYLNDVSAGRWRLGLVTESYVQTSSEQRNWQRFVYDDEYNLIRVDDADGRGGWMETSYAYNDRGLKSQTMAPTGSTESITYDDDHAYPVRVEVKDADGESVAFRTMTVDPNHGEFITETSETGVKTSHDRDVWGRRLSQAMQDPSGTMVEVARFSSDLWQQMIRHKTRTISDWNHPESVELETHSNLRGEIIQEMENHFSGSEKRPKTKYHQVNVFDDAGRVVKTGLPLRTDPSTNTSVFPYASVSYDDYGRVLQEELPPEQRRDDTPGLILPTSDGVIVKRYSYSGRDVAVSQGSIVDGVYEETLCSVVKRNLLGRTARVQHVDVNSLGEGYKCKFFEGSFNVLWQNRSTTRYSYNGFGELVEVIDPDGVVTTYSYDSTGRRISDTFAGGVTNTYEYNELGQLAAQVDGEGRSKAFTYDSLGRVVEEYRSQTGQGSATQVSYHYGSIHLDKPTAIAYRRHIGGAQDLLSDTAYSYDPYGRTMKRIVEFPGIAAGSERNVYVTDYDYAFDGRVKTIRYPDGAVQTVKYNEYRLPSDYGVGDSVANTKPIVRLRHYSWLDQARAFNYDNSSGQQFLRQAVEYSTNGRLMSSAVVRGGSSLWQSRSFEWEFNRIRSVTNEMSSSISGDGDQEFAYDGLGRLTKAMGPYGVRRYAYSKGGRLLRKGHLSADDYAYDAERPESELNDCSEVPGMVGELVFESPVWGGDHKIRSGQYRYCASNGVVDFPYTGAFDESGNLRSVGQPAFLPDQRTALQSEGAEDGDLKLGDLYKNYEYIFNHENLLTEIHVWDAEQPAARVVARFGYDHSGNRIFHERLAPTWPNEVVRRVIRPSREYEIVQVGGAERHTKYIVGENGVLASVTTSGDVPLRAAEDASLQGGVFARVDRLVKGLNEFASPQRLFVLLSCVILLSVGLVASLRDRLYSRVRRAMAMSLAWSTLLLSIAGCGNDIHEPGMHIGRSARSLSLTEVWHAHIRDHVGSAQVIIDQDGHIVSRAVYTPYGETFETAGYGDDSIHVPQFAHKDSVPDTGLYFFNARYYDSITGRFISADDRPGARNPHMLGAFNPYAYALNNPVMYNDPSGHVAVITLLGIMLASTAVGLQAVNLARKSGHTAGEQAAAFFLGFGLSFVVLGLGLALTPVFSVAAASYGFGTSAGAFAGAVTGAAEGAVAGLVTEMFDGEQGIDGGDVGIAVGVGAAVGLVFGGGTGRYPEDVVEAAQGMLGNIPVRLPRWPRSARTTNVVSARSQPRQHFQRSTLSADQPSTSALTREGGVGPLSDQARNGVRGGVDPIRFGVRMNGDDVARIGKRQRRPRDGRAAPNNVAQREGQEVGLGNGRQYEPDDIDDLL